MLQDDVMSADVAECAEASDQLHEQRSLFLGTTGVP